MHLTALFVSLIAVPGVLGICPGFNYGITAKFPAWKTDSGGRIVEKNRWTVYDSRCFVHEYVILNRNENVCKTKAFGCAPDQSINFYTSSMDGLK